MLLYTSLLLTALALTALALTIWQRRQFSSYSEIIASYEGLCDDQRALIAQREQTLKETQAECQDKYLEGWIGAGGTIQDYHAMYHSAKTSALLDLEREAQGDTEMIKILQEQQEALDDEIVDRIERVLKKMGSTLSTAIPEPETR